jgi:SAM-dependent methyltransferase
VRFNPDSAVVDGMQKEFEKIYKNNFWQYGSGYGSLPRNTVGYRELLQNFMRDHDIKSVVDVGCGDWQFSRLMNWTGIDYLGIDIAEQVVKTDSERFAKPPHLRFQVGSATEVLPTAELLIIREVLQHLPFVAIRKFLHNNALSGRYRYALITNEKNHKGEVNLDARPNGQVNARGLDLSAAPFNLPNLQVVYTHLEIETVLYDRNTAEAGASV